MALDLKHWKPFLLGFHGRFSRAQFRRAFLAYGLLALVFFLFALLVVLMSSQVAGLGQFLGYLFGLAFVILLMVSVVAVSVKRLHDLNFSGWWIPVWYLILAALLRLPRFLGWSDTADVAPALLEIGTLIILGSLPGTRGPNRFGSQP